MAIAASEILKPVDLLGSYREKINSEFAAFFEAEAPTWRALQQVTEQDGEIGPFGLRIPIDLNLPGGHGGFTMEDPSYQRAVPSQQTFMIATPVGYALPSGMLGRTIDMLKKGDGATRQGFQRELNRVAMSATKFVNRLCHGDRTGALAYSAGVAAAGSNILVTCETTPAAGSGHTKGAAWLELGHIYDVVTPGTNTVVGQATITTITQNRATARATLTAAIAAGDAFVPRNSWKRFWPGFGHLFGNAARVLQGLDTAAEGWDLNDPTFNLGGLALTPAAFSDARAALNSQNNKKDAMQDAVAIMPHGQFQVLARQGFGLRQSTASENTTYGYPSDYKEPGLTIYCDSDGDEDRVPIFKPSAIKILMERKLGANSHDGQTWRQWQGNNEHGSDLNIQDLTTVMTLAKVHTRGSVLIRNANITGVAGQVNTFQS